MSKIQSILLTNYEYHTTKRPTIADLPCSECFTFGLDFYLKCNLSVIIVQFHFARAPYGMQQPNKAGGYFLSVTQ